MAASKSPSPLFPVENLFYKKKSLQPNKNNSLQVLYSALHTNNIRDESDIKLTLIDCVRFFSPVENSIQKYLRFQTCHT